MMRKNRESDFSESDYLMATKEPKYEVEAQADVYEIRRYASIIVAETQIDASFDEAGNQAFRILASYIFGNNTSRTKIAMTAPVSQLASEKIAMTAPVTMTKEASTFCVQFTMPEEFTLETLPKPNDARVKIREIPARRVAVLRYSGVWSEKKYEHKLEELLAALKRDEKILNGDPIFARFNPPFLPWFLRRNEIWIEIV